MHGPVLLFIMGLGTQMIAWPDSLRFGLAELGYRVVRFDNRDVGLSTKFNGVTAPRPVLAWLRHMFGLSITAPYTLHDMALDTIGLLDAMNIESAHLVGASMGGMIAQIVTSAYPQRVRSLTAMMTSTGRRSLPGPRRAVRNHALFGRPNGRDTEQLIRFGVRNWQLIGSPAYPTAEEHLRIRVQTALQRSYYPQGFIRQLAAIAATGSIAAVARTISASTLVIHGTADVLVPVKCGMDVATTIPNARMELVPGMGHDLPEPLIPTLVEMIAGHVGASGEATDE